MRCNLFNYFYLLTKYYQNNLLTKEGSQALSYLKNRGFTDDVIKEFGIGVSLKNKLVQIYRTKKYIVCQKRRTVFPARFLSLWVKKQKVYPCILVGITLQV